MVKHFESYSFYLNKVEIDTLDEIIRYLDPKNADETEEYEEYREHLLKYNTYVGPSHMKEKVQECKQGEDIVYQLQLTEPEMRWMKKGLLEKAENAMNSTENGDWALDYAEIELEIVKEFGSVLDEKWGLDQLKRFENLR